MPPLNGVGDSDPPSSSLEPPPGAEPVQPTRIERVLALLEVLICSGYPTQTALAATFLAFGFGPGPRSEPSLTFVVLVLLADTVLLLGLIVMFLRLREEQPAEIFFGGRSIVAEARAGVSLALVALVLGIAMMSLIRILAPSLHNEETNPLQNLIHSPRDAIVFGAVVIIAGGVREEVQRAFLLRRFERWLGGDRAGIVVTSLLFGYGHRIQGYDAAIATGLLGAFWGVIYLRRRSVVAPVVSHSGFNVLQLVQFVTVPR